MGKVYKVEKVRSTFHTFHDYLNFCGEKKDDRLFTIYLISAVYLVISTIVLGICIIRENKRVIYSGGKNNEK